MNLENIIKKELEKREEIEKGERAIYFDYVKDYEIEKTENDNVFTTLDLDKLKADGKEEEYNRILSEGISSEIKLQILRDFIKSNSDLSYDSVNVRTISQLINYSRSINNSRYGEFCDVVPTDVNDNRELAVFFDKTIDVTNLKNLSVDEQERTFTNYLLKTIYDMGYTNEDLYQACNSIGMEFGGVEKEHSRSL